MASIITATTTSGLTQSADNSGVLQLASGTGNLVTIPSVTGTADVFPSGTRLLFQQTSAPTGWTKDTTHNDKALRVVSGAASSGGSVNFSTAFSSQNVGSTTLTTSQLPAHGHDIFANSFAGNLKIVMGPLGPDGSFYSVSDSGNDNSDSGAVFYAASTGGGGSHTHSLNIAVNYVDVIIATKD
jgi:microcystin-dependent protein